MDSAPQSLLHKTRPKGMTSKQKRADQRQRELNDTRYKENKKSDKVDKKERKMHKKERREYIRSSDLKPARQAPLLMGVMLISHAKKNKLF